MLVVTSACWEPGLRDHLPTPRRRLEIHPEQNVKCGHNHTGQARAGRAPLSVNIFNQLFSPQNNHTSVEIEERKTGSLRVLWNVSRLPQKALNLIRTIVLAMANMFVERGHGTTWSSHHQQTFGV